MQKTKSVNRIFVKNDQRFKHHYFQSMFQAHGGIFNHRINKFHKIATKKVFQLDSNRKNKNGGESEIRTRVKISPKQHFQCCAFNRSAISPN